MAGKQRYTKEQVEEALRSSRGLITVAARKLGCYPNTVKNYCGRYESVAQAIEDSRETLVDGAELRLVEAVEKKGDMRAIIFVLETLGKKRGYVKRTEIGGEDGGAIPHHHMLEMGGFSNDELRSIVERATGRGSTGAGTP